MTATSTTTTTTGSAPPATADGSVWEGWFARVDESKMGSYREFLGRVYRHQLDAWVREGLIVSYKILRSMPASADDWNLGILLEHRSYAELDVPDDIWEAIEERALDEVRSPETEHLIAHKNEWRRVIGSRLFREIAWV